MGWLERKLAQTGPVEQADATHMVDFALRGLARERN